MVRKSLFGASDPSRLRMNNEVHAGTPDDEESGGATGRTLPSAITVRKISRGTVERGGHGRRALSMYVVEVDGKPFAGSVRDSSFLNLDDAGAVAKKIRLTNRIVRSLMRTASDYHEGRITYATLHKLNSRNWQMAEDGGVSIMVRDALRDAINAPDNMAGRRRAARGRR